MKILKYLNEDNFKIVYENNLLNINNFKEIILISENKIILKEEKEINIIGENMTILKLLDNEILINGLINKIEIR